MSFLKKLTKDAKKAVSSMGDNVDRGLSRGQSIFSHMGEEQQVFLHGYLIIKIISARDIPDMENWYSKIVNKKDVTDAFVDVKLGKSRIAKTAVIDNDLNPVWNEAFRIEVCHKSNSLIFDVRDKDHAYTEEIGKVEINTQLLLDGAPMEGFFPIIKGNKDVVFDTLQNVLKTGTFSSERPQENGQLELFVQYVSMSDVAETSEVTSYFPMHRGCKVTLYQDAHCTHDIPWLNMVQGPPSIPPENRSCWMDLYYSIRGAQHLICITGWAVWTKLKLFRGEDALNIYGDTLGRLLCEKADEGVQVRVMIWSEKSSGDIFGDEGMMGTHDMETYKFFKDPKNYQTQNKVICALTPRELDTKELTDSLQNQFSSSMYTHHQKSVILDEECSFQPDGRRKLIAYVGGLDLTGGRYDTPYHPLFSTLKTDHDGDFRNSNAKGTPPHTGPREPWHDIHCKVEGPVARDVLENFIERWEKQGPGTGTPYIDDKMMRSLNPVAVSPVSSPDREWNVQFFRSITSDSAVFDQKKMNDEMLLSRKKGRFIEQSITQAYIQMIRNAQNFIYIENQYFMGSAYEWDTDNQTLCNHTIPAEIVAKIANKIKAGERLTA
ncbi:phospholipase D alpha 1 [Eurytemora carolleeae]|uniref:phospholipase D alpha 1 n=1 Tax=Eurytemora carolleeae TaxID=1294199 RepID=UPI000C770009|nr:phospholipase D alpha 1 [Eurytemora carolleeae]|eukprot:XP_023324728.1 phospholipase D alpha 1-like [Eurytemora affinis]